MTKNTAPNNNGHPELVSPSDLQGTPCQARSDDKKNYGKLPSQAFLKSGRVRVRCGRFLSFQAATRNRIVGHFAKGKINLKP